MARRPLEIVGAGPAAKLSRIGMPLDFEPAPVREIVCFDSPRVPYRLGSAGRPV